MAMTAYLRLKGLKQGDIKGSVTRKGNEGRIAVVAASHQIVSPRDAASGLPTGRRQHKPFVITKEIDVATPHLYAALVNNEVLSEFELQFWAQAAAGKAGTGVETQRYTVRLSNASISDIQFRMSDVLDPALAKLPELEDIAFTYDRIQWLWVAGGVSAEDSWTTRMAAPAPAPEARRKGGKKGKGG